MSIAEQYCRYGLKCLELVRRTDDLKLQERLVDLAKSWRELAEKESADPVRRIKQRILARERALAKIDVALTDFANINLDRSHLSEPEKIDTRFAGRAVEQHRLTLRQASQAWLNSESTRSKTVYPVSETDPQRTRQRPAYFCNRLHDQHPHLGFQESGTPMCALYARNQLG